METVNVGSDKGVARNPPVRMYRRPPNGRLVDLLFSELLNRVVVHCEYGMPTKARKAGSRWPGGLVYAQCFWDRRSIDSF